jgi:hypothetical protein
MGFQNDVSNFSNLSRVPVRQVVRKRKADDAESDDSKNTLEYEPENRSRNSSAAVDRITILMSEIERQVPLKATKLVPLILFRLIIGIIIMIISTFMETKWTCCTYLTAVSIQ